MDPEKLKEEAEKRRKNGWLDVWLAFEAVAVKKDLVEGALNSHLERMGKSKDLLIYEKNFKEAQLVKNIPPHLKKKLPENAELWSYVADVRALFKDFFTLLNIIIVYGPSAVEILGPNSKIIKMDEMQNIANTVAGLLHEFAGAGVGGVVISGER